MPNRLPASYAWPAAPPFTVAALPRTARNYGTGYGTASRGAPALRSVAVSPNLLTRNQSTFDTDLTGVTNVTPGNTGWTVARDATGKAYQGAGSLKLTSTGASGTTDKAQVNAPAASYVPGALYVASGYIRGSGQVFITPVQQGIAQIGTSVRYGAASPLTDTGWIAFSVTFTAPTTNTSHDIGLQFGTETVGVAFTAWIDALQILPVGASVAGALASAWQQGGWEYVTPSAATPRGLTISGVPISHYAGDGADLFLDAGTLHISNAIGQRSTGSLTVVDEAGAHHYDWGNPVQQLDDSASIVFGGFVQESIERQPGQTALLEHELSLMDYHYLTDKRTWGYSATNKTAGAIVADLLSQVLNAEGVRGGVVMAGPLVAEFTSNYATASQALDALAQAAGFYWQIDVNNRLWFAQGGIVNGPAITVDSYERGTLKVTRGNPLYRNRQYEFGGTAQTSTQTETRKGDGTTTAFTMGYPLSTVPTITKNGGAQTVGIKGVDTGKDWYWAKGDAVIAQDTAGVVLVGTDTLQVVYVGQFQAIVLSDLGSEQTAQAAREGGYTSGIVEAVDQNTTLSTSAGAFQAAAGFLQKYGTLGKQVEFTTRQSGYVQGQLCTVTLPAHAINGLQMLVESVDITTDGTTLWYAVRAVEGPISLTWPQFFTNLAGLSPSSVAKINVGQNSSLITLTTFTYTLAPAWSMALTATSYPVAYPSPTSYPSPTRYPPD